MLGALALGDREGLELEGEPLLLRVLEPGAAEDPPVDWETLGSGTLAEELPTGGTATLELGVGSSSGPPVEEMMGGDSSPLVEGMAGSSVDELGS